MTTETEIIPVWKKHRRASEAVYEADKRRRTLRNWKTAFDIDVPIDKFETFKKYKKFYIQLIQLREEIDREVIDAILDNEL